MLEEIDFILKSAKRFNLTAPYIIVDIIDYSQILLFNKLIFSGLSLLCNSIFIISVTSTRMFHKLNRFLILQSKKLNSNYQAKSKLTKNQLARKISLFCKEHNRITKVVHFTNRTLINKFLFGGFLTVNQFNIFISALILLNKLEGFNQLMALSCLISELSCAIMVVLIMLNCNNSIYSSKKHLIRLQIAMGQYQLRNKIQLQRLHESVTGKPIMGFSAGPFGTITPFSLFKV